MIICQVNKFAGIYSSNDPCWNEAYNIVSQHILYFTVHTQCIRNTHEVNENLLIYHVNNMLRNNKRHSTHVSRHDRMCLFENF